MWVERKRRIICVCSAIDLQVEFLSQFHHSGLSQTAEFLMLNIEVLLKGKIVNLQTEEIKKKTVFKMCTCLYILLF